VTLVSTSVLVIAVAFLVVAAIAAIASIATVGQFVVTNRRARLARHESIRSYYSGFALTS
jgi:hypothetical protein